MGYASVLVIINGASYGLVFISEVGYFSSVISGGSYFISC